MGIVTRLWSLRRDQPFFVAVSLLTLGLLLVYPAIEVFVRSLGIAQAWNYQDFGAYTIAVNAWQAGDPIYTPNANGGFWGKYLYPPVFLILFWPFTHVSQASAGLAWGVLSIGLLWIGLQMVVAQLGGSLRWWERLLGLWALIGFHPLLLSVKLGQTGAFLAAMLSFALVSLLVDDQSHAVLSGALTAGVGIFKLAYAPVGVHILADKDRLVGAIATGVTLLSLSVALFGIDAHLAYLDVFRWGLERSGGGRLPKPALWMPPYYRQLHWLPGAMVVRLGIAAVVSLGAILARDVDREIFVLGIATFLLITPLPYVYYFVAVLPAVLGMLVGELERDGVPAVPVVALLLLQIHGFGLRLLADELPEYLHGFPDVGYPLLQPGLWGVVLLFGLAASRVGQAVVIPTPIANTVRARVSDERYDR